MNAHEIDYEIFGEEMQYVSIELDPQEAVQYISKHDNETLFDAVQFKLPVGASMAERVRAHNMGLSVIALGQGVPFFHAGTDMLRSKSLDRDSYNSGDWFNKGELAGLHTRGEAITARGRFWHGTKTSWLRLRSMTPAY